MINAVNREIPDELLKNGKEVYQGKNYMDGKYFKKDSPKSKRYVKPLESKLCASIREACEKCGAHDGMTFSFHSEFRDGDAFYQLPIFLLRSRLHCLFYNMFLNQEVY